MDPIFINFNIKATYVTRVYKITFSNKEMLYEIKFKLTYVEQTWIIKIIKKSLYFLFQLITTIQIRWRINFLYHY